ncbi:MAG: sigma-70 family RNA polymerase sigma factor, partial [Phycisphaerae bacterium]
PPPKVPRDVPAYLRSLYLTPLLTAEQERDLFRRYNYLKHKVSGALRDLDPDEITPPQDGVLGDLIGRVEEVRKRIIAANLRLVVSIARKHVGWSPNFFEVISDGNMSLMRAVERFDYARGTKFSTYATWAIVKNYARSIPEQHYHCARYVTGQDELLHATADHRPAAPHGSDRKRIREIIAAALTGLSEREREVVRGHFGLGGRDTVLTLDQLGRRFGVTKERIRQIEQKALSRLRATLSPSLADALPD